MKNITMSIINWMLNISWDNMNFKLITDDRQTEHTNTKFTFLDYVFFICSPRRLDKTS